MTAPFLNLDPSDFAGALRKLNSTKTGITAHAGGAQQAASPLTANHNVVATVATAADSVTLPKGYAGAAITVFNQAAANSLDIYPNTGETINALAANAAYALAAGKAALLICLADGKWYTLLSA